jgi:hypothetical protein
MPRRSTIKRAQQAKRAGKAPTTQAGAFVKEEIVLAKKGKRSVKGRKQAIAIGLSKARAAGVKVPRKSAATKARRGASIARKAKSGGARTRTRTTRTSRASRR